MIAIWLTVLCLIIAIPILADDSNPGYQLGRGFPLGNSGFALGGYASTHLESFGKWPASFSLSNLSLFVTWDNGGKLRFFSETEGENVLNVGGKRTLSTSGANLHFERMYFDYLVTDTLSVRIGKMLTPVGQWNLIHVDPLVWTTTRPVATTNLFSDYANGVMLQGTVLLGERVLDYSVYGDYSSVLIPSNIDGPAFDNAQGLRLRYHYSDNLQLGFSYADYALTDNVNVRNHLAGFDFAWSYRRYLLNSEIVYRNNNAAVNQNAWQGYVQGVAPIISGLYAVARYEFFDWSSNWDNHLENRGLGQAGVVGLAYRLQSPMVFKLEYRTGTNNRELAPDGMYASFSALF
ncbi:MAG: hypothetical protein ABSB19_15135 [Methylomonas sp.]|jgi:hypothetical protein